MPGTQTTPQIVFGALFEFHTTCDFKISQTWSKYKYLKFHTMLGVFGEVCERDLLPLKGISVLSNTSFNSLIVFDNFH